MLEPAGFRIARIDGAAGPGTRAYLQASRRVSSERLGGHARGPTFGQAGRKQLWIAGDQSQSEQAIRGCDADFTRQTETHRG